MNREFLYITTIADAKSISRAAQMLYISQPSLSHCLSTVEDRIGTKLFQRSTKGLTLTYAGEEYYKMASQILQIYGDFENGITQLNELKRGRIAFGITNFLGAQHLHLVLPNFVRQYPNIELNMEEQNSETLERMLSERKLHFALMHTTPQIEETRAVGVTAHTLVKEPFVLVTQKNSPLRELATQAKGDMFPTIHPQHLTHEKFVLVHRSQRIRHVADHVFRKAKLRPQIALTTKNFETARRLCSRGMGVTLTPLHYCTLFSGALDCDYYLLPPEYEAYWTLSICTPSDSYIPLGAKELIRFFYRQIKRLHPQHCEPMEL